jgi:hypothetical protein
MKQGDVLARVRVEEEVCGVIARVKCGGRGLLRSVGTVEGRERYDAAYQYVFPPHNLVVVMEMSAEYEFSRSLE